MGKITIWRSDFPELKDAQFATSNDVIDAENKIMSQRTSAQNLQTVKNKEKYDSAAIDALKNFASDNAKMNRYVATGQDEASTNALNTYGNDAWMNPKADTKDLQRVGEAQALLALGGKEGVRNSGLESLSPYADNDAVKNILALNSKANLQDESMNFKNEQELLRRQYDEEKRKETEDFERWKTNRIIEARPQPVQNDPESFKNVMALRKEFDTSPEIKTLQVSAPNYNKAVSTFERYKKHEATPYEIDQALGYFASKALDPNSVVMPGEFDRFARGIGVSGGVEAFAKQALSGGLKLTDAQRQSMMNIVENGYMRAKESANEKYSFYNNVAKKYGIDPQDVTGGADYLFRTKKEPAQQKVSATTIKPQSTQKDTEAVIWAKNNPNDPRSAQILKLNGL